MMKMAYFLNLLKWYRHALTCCALAVPILSQSQAQYADSDWVDGKPVNTKYYGGGSYGGGSSNSGSSVDYAEAIRQSGEAINRSFERNRERRQERSSSGGSSGGYSGGSLYRHPTYEEAYGRDGAHTQESWAEIERRQRLAEAAKLERQKAERLRQQQIAEQQRREAARQLRLKRMRELEAKERRLFDQGIPLSGDEQRQLAGLRDLLSNTSAGVGGASPGSLSSLIGGMMNESVGSGAGSDLVWDPNRTTMPESAYSDYYAEWEARKQAAAAGNQGILPEGYVFVPGERALGGRLVRVPDFGSSADAVVPDPDAPEEVDLFYDESGELVSTEEFRKRYNQAYGDMNFTTVQDEDADNDATIRQALLASTELNPGRPVKGRVEKIQGKVLVKDGQTGQIYRLREGDRIYDGDGVQTPSNGRVKLNAYEGMAEDGGPGLEPMVLGPDSRYDFDGQTDRYPHRDNLEQGEVRSKRAKDALKESVSPKKTPTGVTGVRARGR